MLPTGFSRYALFMMMLGFLLVAGGWPSVVLATTPRALQLVDPGGNAIGLYKASYALVIGVSDYTRGWPDLPGVDKDTTRLETALKDQGFQVTTVRNPTHARLREAFDSFITRYGLESEHRLLIYFAGHGHTIRHSYGDEMGYIVPADAPNPHQDRNGFFSTAMDMQQIEVYARRIQAKHTLFLFDSCFSGAIFALSREAPPQHISYKTSQPVRQFITSGSADEKVPDQSIFLQELLTALRGAGDLNNDGYVTGTELGEFLTSQVINYSRGSQHPQYGKIRNAHLDKGDFVFKIDIPVNPNEPGARVGITASGSGASAARLEQRLVELLEQQRQAGKVLDPEVEMWGMVKDSTHPEDMQAFLAAYPKSSYAPAARLRLQQLQRQAAVPAPAGPSTARLELPSSGQIRNAQQQLKRLGLYTGAADGKWGQRTAEAVRHYQQQRGLTVSGWLDEATFAALRNEDYRQETPRPHQHEEVRQRPSTTSETGPRTVTNSLGMEFVYIPAGSFQMGSVDGGGDERPVRPVTISRPFYLGKHEVTHEQWVAVMGSNPSYFSGDTSDGGTTMQVSQNAEGFFKLVGNQQSASTPPPVKLHPKRPVENVSWEQAQEFIKRLNTQAGRQKYRLPTEAEWEYAARAGSLHRYAFGDADAELTQYAWHVFNSGNKTHPVGQLKPNAWGLYDMHGNVAEWVQDGYGLYPAGVVTDPTGPTGPVAEALRVFRGGSWANVALHCSSAARGRHVPQARTHLYGFRVAMTGP